MPNYIFHFSQLKFTWSNYRQMNKFKIVTGVNNKLFIEMLQYLGRCKRIKKNHVRLLVVVNVIKI